MANDKKLFWRNYSFRQLNNLTNKLNHINNDLRRLYLEAQKHKLPIQLLRETLDKIDFYVGMESITISQLCKKKEVNNE